MAAAGRLGAESTSAGKKTNYYRIQVIILNSKTKGMFKDLLEQERIQMGRIVVAITTIKNCQLSSVFVRG